MSLSPEAEDERAPWLQEHGGAAEARGWSMAPDRGGDEARRRRGRRPDPGGVAPGKYLAAAFLAATSTERERCV